MQKAIFISFFLLLLQLPSQAVAQPILQDQANEINRVIDGYYDAWNQHDTKKMAEFYAADGDLRTPWNEIGKNRKEIEAIYASEHVKQMKNAHIDKSVNSIRMINPNLAFVDVESTIKGMQASDEKQYSPLHHHVIFLLIEREGKWQILIGRPF